jgi:uncharacterized protein (TIGR00255 family)
MEEKMTVYSMTGYSRAEGPVGGARLTVEIKSVNHRYLDFRLHLPRELMGFEPKLNELIRAAFSRGRLECWVGFIPGLKPVIVRWNEPLARGIHAALLAMRQALELAGEPDLSLLALQKDVIVADDSGVLDERAGEELSALFLRAFEEMKTMRAGEGAQLAADLLSRLDQVEGWARGLEQKKEAVALGQRERLSKRLRELLSPESRVDPDRLAMEVAIMADRADITEELVRFKSHVGQFRAIMAGEGPKGRKLDFILQELFREVNTASNKAQDSQVSALAVEIKTELEKIREQVQNLE